jgi:type 1 glutamine amidotransferase
LLASDYEYTQERFYSAAIAVREQRIGNEGWERPPGSNLVGWTKTYGKSRIVYLQCGHDSVAFACPEFQLLLKNAIHWVAAH